MSSSLKAALAGTLLLAFGGTCQASLDTVAQALASGDVPTAKAQLTALSPKERTSYRGRLLEASVLAASGKTEEAERQYRALIKDSPEQPESYNNLAVLYAQRGMLDKALELLEQAINTNASYATVRDNLSRIYLEKSLDSYAKALRIGKRDDSPKLQALYNAGSIPSAPATVLAANSPPVVHDSAPVIKPQPVIEVKPTPPVQPAAPVVTANNGPSAVAKPMVVNRDKPQTKPYPRTQNPLTPAPDEVIQAVRAWAHSWQEQDVTGYLASYVDEFTPPQGMTHNQWKAQRRKRLSRPEHIEVRLENIAVGFDDAAHARAEFIQHYRSDTYHDTTRKQLSLTKRNGAWQITKETTLEVIH